MDPCHCPHCGNDLADQPFPLDSMHYYGGTQGEPMDCQRGCGRPAHGSRIIAIYDRGADRTVAWQCPDCGVRSPRRPQVRPDIPGGVPVAAHTAGTQHRTNKRGTT